MCSTRMGMGQPRVLMQKRPGQSPSRPIMPEMTSSASSACADSYQFLQAAQLLGQPLTAEKQQYYQQLADQSVKQQHELEQQDDISFNAFVAQYR